MSYGTSLDITLPVVSSTVGPTYAEQVNEALEEIIDVLETKVTPSGMSISADLSFKPGATYYAATNVERVHVENKAATLSAAAYPCSIYCANNEWYLNDGQGNTVQITLNGQLDATTTGGVAGSGYGDPGKVITFSDGDNAYYFTHDTGANDYADLWCDDVRLNDGAGGFVTLTAQTLSSGNYTCTLPAAVPASTSLLQMSSAGTLSTTRAPVVDTATVGTLGAVTASITNLTLNGVALTAAANTSVTVSSGDHWIVSGTGRFKHGEQHLWIPGSAFVYDDSENSDWNRSSGLLVHSAASEDFVYCPIILPGGSRIKAVSLRYTTAGGTDVIVGLYSIANDGTLTLVDSVTSTTIGPRTATISGLTSSVADDSSAIAGVCYQIRVEMNAINDAVYYAIVTYDYP